LKVLVVTSSYPRFPGDGTAPFVDSISRRVAALGHEVHLLVPEHREWGWPATDGELHFHRYRYSPVRSWTPWGFSAALAGGPGIKKQLYPLAPVVFASATRTARRLLADGTFDVVHAHWLVPNGPIGRAAAGSTPLVLSLHGSDVAVAERSRMIGRVVRGTFERAAAVTAPSTDLLVRAKALGAREPLELIPYGADVATFDASPEVGSAVRARLGIGADDLLVVGIGRLVPVKGFDVLVDAFATASKGDERLRLVLVGDGPEGAELARRVASLDISRSTTLVGAVTHGEIPGFLAAADVVAVPSVQRDGFVDGLPNVALEAMAAGKPLIASRVGGLPDLVRADETGLLVDEQNAAQLAEAILALARDRERRTQLGSAAQAEMRQKRSWTSVAARFVDVYEKTRRD
jgi:phosphatidyl-myo-inositol dimannoside synthase